MVFLAERAACAVEEMDKPDCDPALLHNTYAQFPVINAVVAGWQQTYRRQLRPRLESGRSNSLLDVGCGGGDVARALARWAAKDGFRLDITAIDPDPRAYAYAAAQPPVPGLTFRRAFSSELVAEGQRFDLVISNHVLHHLQPPELRALLADSAVLATRAAVHCDIRRHRLAYLLFSAGTAPFFHRSYIRRDGLTSIRRSYTAGELRAAVAAAWTVRRQPPFRNVLLYEADGSGRA